MAKASVKFTRIARRTDDCPSGFVTRMVDLELSEDEAWFLVDLMACIGGSGDRTKYAQAISAALEKVGYEFDLPDEDEDDMPDVIWINAPFKDQP